MWPQTFDPAKAFTTLRALDTIAGVRAEGEVGIQCGTQDFTGSVQRNHCVADSHLRVESGLMIICCEQGDAEFLGSNGQLLAIGPPHQYDT